MLDDKKPSKYIALAFLLIVVAIGVILFFGIHAQAEEKKFLPIQDVTTPSGLSVWLVEDHSLPIVAVQYIFLESGSANDPDGKQGLARMLSNTMDEGAGDMDSQTFQKVLSDKSISLTFNASRDGFGGNLKTLTRNEEAAFALLGKAIQDPRFDAEAVNRMRDANLVRIKSAMSQPDWMAARLINDRAFEGHPYAKNSGGTLTSLAGITPDDLRSFKKSYLTKDRLLVTVTGDITPDQVKKLLDKTFASLPDHAPQTGVKDTSVENTDKVYLYEQPIPQTMVEILMPAFGREDKDYYALQVLNYIFGGAGFGSRLMDEIREKRGLTYGIYSSVDDYQHLDAISISTSTKNESAAEVLDLIKSTMLKLQKESVGAKELADAKSYITGSMPLSLSSTDQIAGIVMSIRVDKLPIDYLDHFAEKINAVTPADIQRVAQRVLKPETMVTVLVGKPEHVTNVQRIEKLPNVE